MRIIDEKGRLLGKINVIDLSVVVFLLSLTLMFYFGYKIFNSKSSQSQTQQQEKINLEVIRDGLDLLEKKVDSSLLQITNRLGEFESKFGELENRVTETVLKEEEKKRRK